MAFVRKEYEIIVSMEYGVYSPGLSRVSQFYMVTSMVALCKWESLVLPWTSATA